MQTITAAEQSGRLGALLFTPQAPQRIRRGRPRPLVPSPAAPHPVGSARGAFRTGRLAVSHSSGMGHARGTAAYNTPIRTRGTAACSRRYCSTAPRA